MLWFHLGQLVLLLVIVLHVARRVRALFFEAKVGVAFERAFVSAVEAGDFDDARALVARGGQRFLPRYASAYLDGCAESPLAARLLPDEVVGDLCHEAFDGLRSLRSLASMSSAAGFLGATIELLWLWGGEHGIEGLLAGAVETEAAEGAMFSVALGIAGATIALSALQKLKAQAQSLVRDLRRFGTAVQAMPVEEKGALEAGSEAKRESA